MLNKAQMMKIALNECIDMIGEELVNSHKELCCASYCTTEEGLFSYCLGMDTELKKLPMGDETPMEFYAFVIIDPETGKITRDYNNSILPKCLS